ncbi:reverse transcriptase domain-containing protein [Tanacetum coccineum]|uniref:Reverse transcriptase domain-containing protein n=1 Tax=Tanacetum coccineum TaxID=301880 RepID=A0ABQ4XR50_9ASTR
MDLKTQLEIVAKNHQASIQNLETKFDRLADKQSGRPSGSLLSNTQPNPRGNNSKAYQPLQSRNEHVNAVFTRSGKSYDPPDNPNDQQNNFETPINFDSDADLGASINLMPYSLYEKLSLETLKPTKMSIRLADQSFQYPVGIAGNMLVEVDEGSKILYSIKETILEEEIFSEFDKVIVMASNENYDSESDEEEPKFEKITINTDYKIKTSLEEPPTDVELKPLPDNLEYVFLEEPSFLPVIISSQLSA